MGFDAYEKKGVTVLRTDQLGTIVLTSNGEEISSQGKVIVPIKDIKTETDIVYTAPDGTGLIKGNINSSGEKIYHMPGGVYYDKTNAEEYFKTEKEAVEHGFRKSSR